MNLLEKYKAMIEPERQRKEEAQPILSVITPQPTEEALPEYIWRNPYPQGTPEARAESLRVVEAARRGETI